MGGLFTFAAFAVLASALFQPSTTPLGVRLRYIFGLGIACNYLVLWLIPMAVQGAVHKQLLVPYVVPIYSWLDQCRPLRAFAESCIYARAKHSDFFVTQLIFIVNFTGLLLFVLQLARWQMEHGRLSWWSIAVYNFWWVGVGARNIGTAYFMAHKEAHNLAMYKPWIRGTVGNFFENWVGLLYGGVPNNFTTSHIALHHRLDGGVGDTLYCWDLNRSSWPDFMVYLSRAFLHMTGFGALYQFHTSPRSDSCAIEIRSLMRGVFVYWVLMPACVLWFVPSISWFFWIVLQPMLCMTFFLALINLGFHAFIESDSEGRRVQCVESITLIGSDDNFFGEDDHMMHHYHPLVYWSDADAHQQRQHELWARHHASVFQGADIFCFSLYVLLKAWPLLATRFIDYSGKLSQREIAALLELRARRRDMEHTVLLPALPASKARGYGAEPKTPPEEGGQAYNELMRRLLSFQQGIAALLEQGLPPVKALPVRSSKDSPVDQSDHAVQGG